MLSLQESTSTLTDRYQTTVPEPVRRALKLGKRDRIHYVLGADGLVTMQRADDAETQDPVLAKFLDFLALDMQQHPQNLQAVRTDFAANLQALTKGVVLDLNAALPPEHE